MIPLLLLAGMNLANAQETSVTTSPPGPEQARATWQALTPEQQAAKQAAVQGKMQPYSEPMQSRMLCAWAAARSAIAES